ncbi:MAG: GtrA family protein, partial [Proteobacteria bacterium]|nr:GtrA family protein [Pseudomonadota bacterium]
FRFNVQGYVFQVALLHYLNVSGARISEVPIAFHDRTSGKTKLSISDIAGFFFHVCSLGVLRYSTFIKFILTGTLGVLVNLATFEILLSINLNAYLASAIAVEASIVSNFLINNFWTFRHRTMPGSRRRRAIRFNLVSISTLLISLGTFAVLGILFPENPLVIHQAIAIVPAVLGNYFASSYWTFRSEI